MAKRDVVAQAGQIGSRLARQLGFELVDTALEKEAAGKYLRFYVDTPQGITLDECERFHRAVQPLVEELEYDYLEVSSPGLDRPIRTAQDAQRALGQPVEIKLYHSQDGVKVHEGILRGLDSAGYHLEENGSLTVYPSDQVALARRKIDVEAALAQAQQTQEAPDERTET